MSKRRSKDSLGTIQQSNAGHLTRKKFARQDDDRLGGGTVDLQRHALNDGLLSFVDTYGETSKAKREVFRDAEVWLNSNVRHPFSFLSLCEQFGRDPETVRRNTRVEAREARQQRIEEARSIEKIDKTVGKKARTLAERLIEQDAEPAKPYSLRGIQRKLKVTKLEAEAVSIALEIFGQPVVPRENVDALVRAVKRLRNDGTERFSIKVLMAKLRISERKARAVQAALGMRQPASQNLLQKVARGRAKTDEALVTEALALPFEQRTPYKLISALGINGRRARRIHDALGNQAYKNHRPGERSAGELMTLTRNEAQRHNFTSLSKIIKVMRVRLPIAHLLRAQLSAERRLPTQYSGMTLYEALIALQPEAPTTLFSLQETLKAKGYTIESKAVTDPSIEQLAAEAHEKGVAHFAATTLVRKLGISVSKAKRVKALLEQQAIQNPSD